MKLSKMIFALCFACIFVAVFAVEGGGFSLAQGLAVGLIGSIGSLATMQGTGWFE